MGPRKLKNVLPNTYIPKQPQKSVDMALSRLSKRSLIDIMKNWTKHANTQPHLQIENPANDSKIYNDEVYEEIQRLESLGIKITKKHLTKCISKYWWKGLNLLQFSQIDCQVIIDKPQLFAWVSSVVRDDSGVEAATLIDPGSFLRMLVKELSKSYMCYVYICKHSDMPLYLTRVQVFDLNSLEISGSKIFSLPHISSYKPIFVALPMNSPYIFHSMGDGLVNRLVLQVVERCLPQSSLNLLTIQHQENPRPIKTLETMQIMFGNSRFGNSLGMWTPYADGTVDLSPLDPVAMHPELKYPSKSSLSDREKLANLKFKGSVEGKLVSKRLYDDIQPQNRRKRIKQGSDTLIGEDMFASIAPIQYAEVMLNETIKDSRSSITLKLVGQDVFAGLHELLLHEDNILDPSEVPPWLSGGEGITKGSVRDGVFRSISLFSNQ